MLITYYDAYSVLSKVYANGTFLKQALLDTPVREASRAYLNKICYGVLDKDITLSYIIKSLCEKQPKQAVRILLKIGLYSIIYLKNQPYAVTDNLVELAKKLGKGGTSGFINAVLRNYLRKGYELPTSEIENLSIKYSMPTFVVKALINDYGKDVATRVLSYDTEHTYVRFNSGMSGEEYFKNYDIIYNNTKFSNLYETPNFKMNQDFKNGVYTFQSIGSVAICNLVPKGEKLLDACSAPGGKAVFLADVFSSVTATEIHPHRARLISSYAERMKKENVTVLCMDQTVFCADFFEQFDVVLCDAPCSGTGVLKDNPDIKLNRNSSNVNELVSIQLSLLNNLCNYVKVGGYLCYSTCSVLQDENSAVIRKFLSQHDNFECEDCTSPLEHVAQEYGIQFLPHLSCGAGFYFCKLKKLS